MTIIKTPENIFKNQNGVYLTKQLFIENDLEGTGELAVYSLKGYDHVKDGKPYPSLRRLFVELEDPTEYLFATKYLDSWEHWKRICSQSWFSTHLADWREELEIRVRANSLLRIKAKAESSHKDSLTADKLLLTGGWRDPSSKVGRPTKLKIRQEADRLFAEDKVFDEDHSRIFGAVN